MWGFWGETSPAYGYGFPTLAACEDGRRLEGAKGANVTRITPATKAQHTEIADVWEGSVRATHDFLGEDDIVFLRQKLLEQYLDAAEILVLVDEAGAIRGFLGVAEGNIDMLFIRADSLGQGLGSLLMKHALEELGATRVDVNEQNPAARVFYERWGFRVVRRSPLDGQGRPFPMLHMELLPES